MGCCFGSRGMQDSQKSDVGNLLAPRIGEEKKPPIEIEIEPQTPARTLPVMVSLQPPKEPKEVDSVDALPPVYYVIVGRGPAAVIDHTTLQQSDFGISRLGKLPVMHIGFPNPWTKYMQHGMGQPPRLLSLPGFRRQP